MPFAIARLKSFVQSEGPYGYELPTMKCANAALGGSARVGRTVAANAMLAATAEANEKPTTRITTVTATEGKEKEWPHSSTSQRAIKGHRSPWE